MRKLLACLFIINICLFIVSLAISFTILFRPFYYWQIKPLNLEEKTGLSYNEIREAYDDILDYTTLNKEFSTGVFKHSDDGIDHFKDCKRLFTINFIILGISTIIILIKKKYFNDIKLFKHNVSYWSSILNLGFFSIITIITLFIGFDKLFELFHNVFFLGKPNWIFDFSKDEIIKILPERYFMNCAILILSIVSVISIILIVWEIHYNKKIKEKK